MLFWRLSSIPSSPAQSQSYCRVTGKATKLSAFLYRWGKSISYLILLSSFPFSYHMYWKSLCPNIVVQMYSTAMLRINWRAIKWERMCYSFYCPYPEFSPTGYPGIFSLFSLINHICYQALLRIRANLTVYTRGDISSPGICLVPPSLPN